MYPQSNEPKIQLLTDILISYLEKEDVKFTIEGSDLFPQEVVGHFGCLPLFLLDSKENYEKAFNLNFDLNDLGSAYGKSLNVLEESKFEQPIVANTKFFPISFIDDQEAYFNAIPSIDAQGAPFVIFAHFAHHSVEEYIKYYLNNKHLMIDGKIPLDALYQKWKNALLANKITIKPNNKPALLGSTPQVQKTGDKN